MTEIDYAISETTGRDCKWTVYYFYPDGIWDNHKRTRDEAEIAYPTSEYKWVKIDD